MEKLGLNLGYLIVQIVNFAIIFIVLRAWVYKPLLGMLEKRKLAIEKGLEDARVAAEARASAEGQAAKIIEDAQKKAAEIVREASDRSEAAAQQIKANAEAEVAQKIEAAKIDIETERTRMLQGLRSQVGTLAMAAAQKLIGESLMADKARQQALVDEFFSGIKGGKVVVLAGSELQGSTVEVTSALPLSDQEQETVKKDFLKTSGGKAEQVSFTFDVDPNILGGLVVRVGDHVVDGSVAGQLQNMRQNL